MFFYKTQTPAKRYELKETKNSGGNPLLAKTKRAREMSNHNTNESGRVYKRKQPGNCYGVCNRN